MKLVVVKEQGSTFRNIVDRGRCGGRCYNVFALDTVLIPNPESGDAGKRFSAELQMALKKSIPPATSTQPQQIGFLQMVGVGYTTRSGATVNSVAEKCLQRSDPKSWKMYVTLTHTEKTPEKIEIKVEGDLIDKIRELCGKIEVYLEIKNLRPIVTSNANKDDADTGAEVVTVTVGQKRDSAGDPKPSHFLNLSVKSKTDFSLRELLGPRSFYYYQEHLIENIPPSFVQQWHASAYFTGEFTIEVVFPKWVDTSIVDRMKLNRRMLIQHIGTDTEIVLTSGISYKCHKAFLCAHSPVFEAMFRYDMEECRTGKIVMKDLSARGVQSLLAYIYCWEIGEAAYDMELALEVMKAAHKYNMKDLESSLKQMFLRRPTELYSTGFAVDLFLFGRDMPLEHDLKMKAMQILKVYIKELEQCPKYDDLFLNNPAAAKELCKMAFMT